MKLAVLITIIMILCATECQAWGGACGSRLVDTLRQSCGENGFINPKMMMLKSLYGHRSKGRRRQRRHRRHLAVLESRHSVKVTYAETLMTRSKTNGLLKNIIRKSNNNVKRRSRRRMRRNINRHCCEHNCTLHEAKMIVCSRRGP